MNAADIERLREERKHMRETLHCTEPKCWCGLCHCSKCQKKRQDERGDGAPLGARPTKNKKEA
jgi:hypothetical protein